jgi:hypothetical protein
MTVREEMLAAVVREEANAILRGNVDDLRRLYAENCVRARRVRLLLMLRWLVGAHRVTT